MSNPTIMFKGTEYPLATTLRVAYKIQGQNDHKPYMQIFEGMNEMPIEKQIGMLYAAFVCANPIDAKTVKEQEFVDYCLDNMNLSEMMTILRDVSKGIIGINDDDDDADAKNE